MPDPGIRFRDRAAYLEAADALVLADLHLGRDAASAVELPLGERGDILERVSALVDRFCPDEVVFAGDVVHPFDRLPPGTTDDLDALRETVAETGASLTVVAGNHDGLLPEESLAPLDERRLPDGTLVLHGHEPPEVAADRYVIGHDHPAIRIEGVRRACFLHGAGAYDGGDVLVLPAFNRLAVGTLVNRRRAADFDSPLVRDVGDFQPVVRDEDADETLEFPPLSRLRSFL